MKDKTYFWNDDTQGLLFQGKQIKEGGKIPSDFIKKHKEKFDSFVNSKQISDKAKVTFTEKKVAELALLKNQIDKLKLRNQDLLKSKGDLEKKVEKYTASFEELENLKDIKEELELLKAENADLKKKAKKGGLIET